MTNPLQMNKSIETIFLVPQSIDGVPPQINLQQSSSVGAVQQSTAVPPVPSAFATAAALAAKIIDTKQQQQQLPTVQQPPLSVSAGAIKAVVIHDPVVTLDDADPDLLERKRAELKKELELQLKMETSASRSAKMLSQTGGSSAKEHAHALAMRKRKKMQQSSSSSSSSSSDSSSSDSSSSSSSKESSRRKMKKSSKAMAKRRNSSSSSDEPRVKKSKAKRVCHKKLADPSKLHKSGHSSKKMLAASQKMMRKRSQSPSTARSKRMAMSPSSASRLSHKMAMKSGKLSSADVCVSKHQHRVKEAQLMGRSEKEQLHHAQQRERERERMRSRERGRSRTPKFRAKSRSPKRLSRSREIMHKSPTRGGRLTPTKSRGIVGGGGGSSISSGLRRDRSPEQRSISGSCKKDLKRHASSRERERERLRDKERREREHEAAREKERQEILARCQERQRERERLAREKVRREREEDRISISSKGERLLPRPAERAMALAAALDRSRDKSLERDRPAPSRSHSHSQLVRERLDRDKDHVSSGYERSYERDDVRYHEHDRRLDKDDTRGGGVLLDDRERDYLMVSRRRDDSPYMNRVLDKRMDRVDMVDRDLYGPVVDQRYDEHHLRDDRRDGHVHDYGAVPSRAGVGGGAVDRGSSGYVDDRLRIERDREWIREPEIGHREPVDRSLMYEHPVDRHAVVRDWDRTDMAGGSAPVRDNYNDTRDWGGMQGDHGHGQWDSAAVAGGGIGSAGGGGGGAAWPQEDEAENWDHVDDKEWQDYHRGPDKLRHDNMGVGSGGNVGASQMGVGVGNNNIGGGGSGVGNNGGGGGGNNQNRRWNNWRGRRGNQHHGGNDYRRHNNLHQQQQQQMQENSYPSRAELTFNRRQHQQPNKIEPLLSVPTSPAIVATVNEFRMTQTQPLISIVPKSDAQSMVAQVPKVVVAGQAVAVEVAATVAANEAKEMVAGETMAKDVSAIGDEVLDEDNLSEISDEADEILNRQEVSFFYLFFLAFLCHL